MKRPSKRNVSATRQIWLVGLGLIAVGYRHGRRAFARALAAGNVSVKLAREIAADFHAQLAGIGDIAVEATHRRKH